MNTPICDFVERYAASGALRLHMPGHKGIALTGMEKRDITEISGADDLFHASGIISESEKNASELFETAATLYSTEGSSLCIRAMLLMTMQYVGKRSRQARILAGRNAHKSFITAAALLDFEYSWIEGAANTGYLSCRIDPKQLEERIILEKPDAVYITSPDYLGNTEDIAAISEICKRRSCLLLVDNAHGAYLKFLSESRHPMDLGADICCDSAHKTLPALTGSAYLHISNHAPKALLSLAKPAMALFASTSPSYLILQSLDRLNAYLADGYAEMLNAFLPNAETLKSEIRALGYDIIDNEPMKITLSPKFRGYTGEETAALLAERGIVSEFADPDSVVLMLSCGFNESDFRRIVSALAELPKKPSIGTLPPVMPLPKRAMHARETLFLPCRTIPVHESSGSVFASTNIACPPAVPIVVSGEIIDENTLRMLEYYGVDRCEIIDTNRK